jgi:nucleoside-diphosphate-sugar epimerase
MKKGAITIEGGTQLRPLIHMDDLVDLYVLLLDADRTAVDRQAFNISSDNYRVDAVARMVQAKLPCRLAFTSFTDPRSYHVNTDKARRLLGYRTSRSIDSAIDEIARAFSQGAIQDADSRCYNIRHMKHLIETQPQDIFLESDAAAPAAS